jgi:hypothetical protein
LRKPEAKGHRNRKKAKKKKNYAAPKSKPGVITV